MEKIELRLPTELFDNWIGTEYQRFQDQNRLNPSLPVCIVLALCEFASPMPILCLATEILTHSSEGRIVEIDLGEGGTGVAASNRARTRKFLSLHGLLTCFLTRSDLSVRFQFDANSESGRNGLWFHGSTGLADLRPALERASVELLYGASVVLPATTWRLPSPSSASLASEVRRQVSHLLKQADKSLYRFKTEARKYRDTTLQRLTQLLLELVENAAEHAYDRSTTGYVGLYARVRDHKNREAMVSRAREVGHSPLLDHVLLSESQHQVEIFVVDVGRGLFADATSWKSAKHLALDQHPLRKTAQVLFSRPLSRHDRSTATVEAIRGSSTGLMHLNSILSRQHDRTRIATGREWLAGTHPRGPGFLEDSPYTGGYHLADSPFLGTLIHIGISSAEIPKLESPWFASEEPDSAAVRHAVLRSLQLQPRLDDLQSRVIDIRREDGLANAATRVKESVLPDTNTTIRLNRVAEKNLLNALLDAWIKGVSDSKSGPCALYLCDLGRYQAIDATWVIQRYFRRKSIALPMPKRAAIFVVTEDLCYLRLNLSFEVRQRSLDSLVCTSRVSVAAEGAPNIVKRLSAVVASLRACDSELLWKRIDELNTHSESKVLIRDVYWPVGAGGVVIPYYIDLSILIQDQAAARYIRRALRRILALFPDANDLALDPLIEAPLHDAKKWLVRPPQELAKQVLVGSLSVSGNTLRRFARVPGTEVVGIVDCIRTPYFDPVASTEPHVAALLWDPRLPRATSNRAMYRRFSHTAYIEPLRPRIDSELREVDSDFYIALESDGLLKIGHWAYGDRHSLLEVNAELAIEQSAASEAGVVPWLANRVLEVAAKCKTIVAFPVHRLSYRLAHIVQAKLKELSGGVGDIRFTPLSFLPRVAGGINRFTPLTTELLTEIAAESAYAAATVVFLDVGFFTNRTLRHAARQLRAAGFPEIYGLGLLNRSSAPALSVELTDKGAAASVVPVPRSFWRWNVPTMGGESHCALCAALAALSRLRRVLEEAHPDLLPRLAATTNQWRARDVSDFWEEYGMRPLPLSAKQVASLNLLRLPPQLLIGSLTSSALAARLLEWVRFTGDIEVPIRVVREVANFGGEQPVEILCCLLLLAGNSFPNADRHDYVACLAECALRLGRKLGEMPLDDRSTRLMGLVALVFATQSTRCKLELLDFIAEHLSTHEIVDPSLRIALIAITTDSDESTRVQDAFRVRCEAAASGSTLARNFQAVRPARAGIKATWSNLTEAFGRSSSHSQHSVVGRLVNALRSNSMPASGAVPFLERLGSLVGQCDPRFVHDAFGLDLNSFVDQIEEVRAESIRPGRRPAQIERMTIEVCSRVAGALHESLCRYGDRADSPLVYMLFYGAISSSSDIHRLSMGDDVQIALQSRVMRWNAEFGDYLPLCRPVVSLFDEILSNVASKSIKCAPPALEQFSEGDSVAKCWINFDISSEVLQKGMSILVTNGIDPSKDFGRFVPKVAGLKDFGVNVSSRVFTSGENSYYEVRVRLPSLASILEI